MGRGDCINIIVIEQGEIIVMFCGKHILIKSVQSLLDSRKGEQWNGWGCLYNLLCGFVSIVMHTL